MTKAEIKEFKKFVQDELVTTYHMNEADAVHAVCNSYLSKALVQDSDYVEHDTVEEWAEFVHNEINVSNVLMV